MTEPEFRGFNKEENKWFYGHGWSEIDYTVEYLQEKKINPRAILYTDTSPVECELDSMGISAKTPDYNNKIIFDGDVVKRIKSGIEIMLRGWNVNENEIEKYLKNNKEGSEYFIIHNLGHAFYLGKPDDSKYAGILNNSIGNMSNNLKIVGNLYSNPGLIELFK